MNFINQYLAVRQVLSGFRSALSITYGQFLVIIIGGWLWSFFTFFKKSKYSRVSSCESMSNITIVAAFDIGTTYSGWVYSVKTQPEANPLDTRKMKNPGDKPKVPTALFIPDSGKPTSGYEAIDEYKNFTMEERKDSKYFSRFKMALDQWELAEETNVTADNDNSRSICVWTCFYFP